MLSTLKNKIERYEEREPNPLIQLIVSIAVMAIVSTAAFYLWNEVLAGSGKFSRDGKVFQNGRGYVSVLKPIPDIKTAFLILLAIDIFTNPF